MVAVEGISVLRTMETLPKSVITAAYRAVNRTTERARTASSRLMREQVNWNAQYLTGQNGKLELGGPASADHLERGITGRFRPTSLARFVVGNPTPGKAGVRVQVAPGFAKYMKRAFVIRLPQGSQLTETKANLGLAIRLKPGEVLHNKIKMVKLKGGLTLLFGPSVDQVLSTVAEDVLPDTEAFLAQEFQRLLKLDLP
ncbi:hypothetical protein [Sphingomonas sp. RB3P16]|uniref:hypothetical protein n=1 Tax=Parasphingomonas frigoris TaxID=3096163 RepID=UPI002FC64178